MNVLLALSFLGCIYSYLLYPLILLVLRTLGIRKYPLMPAISNQAVLVATIIITIRNESKVLKNKIENTLAVCAQAKEDSDVDVQIIVASDASDDGSDEIVAEYAEQGVLLVRLEERGGKERAQAEALKFAKGDITIFTDAKIKLDHNALSLFLRYFEDHSVGAVSSVDIVEDSEEGSSGEGMYVRYEMWLRSLESEFHSLIGLSGSCFAVRREVCAELRVDIPSDFSLLIAARRMGFRGIHAPDIFARYKAVTTSGAEFQRKVRTVLRGIATLFSVPEVLNAHTYGIFAWQIISHKLMRWLVPFFMLLFIIVAIATASYSFFRSVLVLGIILFFGLALLGLLSRAHSDKIYCKAPLFFLVVNAAIALAWFKFFTGERSVAWNPSVKAE